MDISHILISALNLVCLIGAITLHEAAHGLTAYAFKDNTAKLYGRLTLNPLKHIDIMGTVILPGILYLSGAKFLLGWAKPVPINFSRLTKTGIICVVLSGPFMNFFLAWISCLVLHVNPTEHTLGNDLLIQFFKVNLMLGIFNMLPIPPLDGGRFILEVLPKKLSEPFSKIEPFTPLIFLGLMVFPPFARLFGMAIFPIYTFMLNIILFLSGH